jgi:methionyl-tRNA formyltransferase
MRILIITQDEPFYLSKSLKYFIKLLPSKFKIVGCVVSSVSPFGKHDSFFKKAVKTLNVFGLNFFVYYSIKFIFYKFNIAQSLDCILKRNNIQKIVLRHSINHEKSIGVLKQYNADILISILANQIFKNELINLAPKGCINLHTALLPKYRGLMPTFWVMKNDEEFTGVSVFYVNEGIDTGPIIIQKRVKIGNKTQEELIKHTKNIGMEAIVDALKIIESGNIKTLNNSDSEMTYYSFPTKEDVAIFQKKNKKFF